MFAAQLFYITFYLICDMWYHLDCFSKKVAAAFLIYHGFIDSSSSQRVCSRSLYVCEPFVMSEIKVGLGAVNCHIAFSVLVWIEGARINVDVRIKLLDCDVVASCLQEFTY